MLAKCPKCGNSIDTKTKICPYCKSELKYDRNEMELKLVKISCPKCGFLNDVDFKFCGRCGTRLAKKCVNCGFETIMDLNFCPKCGRPFSEVGGDSLVKIKDPQEEKKVYTVLVVDDDVYISKLINRILSMENINVISATNGKEALEKLAENEHIDLVITDYMMPEMDGVELLKNIKKNPKTQDLKVIMLTVIDAFEEIRKTTLLGVEEYLVKPFDPSELLWVVKRNLDKYEDWKTTKRNEEGF